MPRVVDVVLLSSSSDSPPPMYSTSSSYSDPSVYSTSSSSPSHSPPHQPQAPPQAPPPNMDQPPHVVALNKARSQITMPELQFAITMKKSFVEDDCRLVI